MTARHLIAGASGGIMFKRWRAAGAALGVFLSLAACGGGGGGGSDLQITLSSNTMTIDAEEGIGGGTQLTATLSGSYDGAVYVAATASGSEIQGVELSFDETHAWMMVNANPALAIGRYAGTLQVKVCSDAACAHAIGGSPFNVAYTVVVHPALKSSPAELSFSSVSGTPPVAQSVTIQLPDDVTDYTAVASHDWLQVIDKTASGFKVQMMPVPSSEYEGHVQITAGNRSLWLPVRHSVSAPAGGDHDLIVDRSGVELTAPEGGPGEPVMLGVTPPTWNPPIDTEVEYVTGSDWLQVTPVDGGYRLVADAGMLSQGTYMAWLHINPRVYVSGTVDVVGVTLTVGPGLVRPADRAVTVGAETLAADLAGSTRVEMVAGPAQHWSAGSDSAWLKIDTPTGMTGTDLRYHVDTALLAAMGNGNDDTAHVSINPDADNISATGFDVTLRKRLPEVRYVAPYALPTGRANSLVVRGIGFAGVTNLSSRLSVQGVSGAVATVVNDTELQLQVPASASAGAHAVAIDNALGLAAAFNTFNLLDGSTLPYAKLPHVGAKRGLWYDPVARALFTVNLDQRAVVRYGFDGTQWAGSSKAYAGLADIGPSPDGTELVAMSETGMVRRLDPTSLAQKAAYDRGEAFDRGTNISQGLAITNDGLVWLAVSQGWNSLETFDIRTGAFKPAVIDNIGTSFYYGPWANVSRNGEHMVMTQSASTTAPMLYMDAKDAVFHENAAGLQFYFHISQSDDGQRVMLEKSAVYDSAFALVGNTEVPDSAYFAVAASLSPDGRRAYVMAYSNSYETSQNVKPRVYVFDSSRPPFGGTALPLLGSFDLADYATCLGTYDQCPANAIATIAADGRTLFFAGHDALLVVPVPQAYQSALGGNLRKQALRAPQGLRPAAAPRLWPR